MKKHLTGILAILLVLLTLTPAFASDMLDYNLFYTYTSVTGAEAAETADHEDTGEHVRAYDNVTRAQFDDYLYTLNRLRFIAFPIDLDKGATEEYLIYHTYSDTLGYLSYDEAAALLSIHMFGELYVISQGDTLKQLESVDKLAYAIPGDAAGYVLAQFYAITGDTPTLQDQMQSDSVFDGQMHWEEWYEGVSRKTIDNYLWVMGALGCEIEGKGISLSDSEDSFKYERLLFKQDGKTLVVLTYLLDDRTAIVAYNPNEAYDLKTGDDLNAMMK